MTTLSLRQKFLKIIYPIWIGFTRMIGKNTKVLSNEKQIAPSESLYDLSIDLSNGKKLNLAELKGRKILFVNTASDCGYTAQYEELQKLHEHSKDKVAIIAIPANDFGNQEKGTDEQIGQFCTTQFSIKFPLAKKSVVIKEPAQNSVYQWLTDKKKNGWNNQPPTWNFSKYLVNEQGVLTHYFDPSVSPLKQEVLEAINQ